MIRGAFILAVGFALGYGKAMSEQEAVSETLGRLKEFLDEVSAAKDKDKDGQEKPETIDSTAEGEDDPS